MNNYAVYATRLDDESQRDSTRIKLDAQGNVINPVNPWGNPWAVGAIRDAQDGRAWLVMRDAMNFLDSVIGEDRDSSTVNAFNQATSMIESVTHAEKLIEKLQIAALNGSEAALIGIVAASIYINRYAFVDFSWFVSASEIADYEGFAVTIRTTTQPAIIATPAPVAIVLATPAPLTLIAPVAPAAPRVIVTPLIIRDAEGRILTATADGWLAESESKPGMFHTVTEGEHGMSCDCSGSFYHGKCWHLAAVSAHNLRKRDTARPSKSRKPRKRGQIRPSKPSTARHSYHPPRPRSRSRMWK